MLFFLLKVLLVPIVIVVVLYIFSKICSYQSKEDKQMWEERRMREQEHQEYIRQQRMEVDKAREGWIEELRSLDIESVESERKITQYVDKYREMPEVQRYIDVIWNGIEGVPGLAEYIKNNIREYKKISADHNSDEIRIKWNEDGFSALTALNILLSYKPWKFEFAGISNIQDEDKQIAIAIVVIQELDNKIQSLESNVYSSHRMFIRQYYYMHYETHSKEISIEEARKLKNEGKHSEIRYEAEIKYGYTKPYRRLTEL